MPRWGMAIDLDRCTGCRACVVACKAENNVPISTPKMAHEARVISWMKLLPMREEHAGEHGGRRQRVEFVPQMCLQCDDPPCVKVCPVGATYRDPEGLVAQIYHRCIGCRYCANNCPYTAKYFNWFDPQWPKELESCHNPDVSLRMRGVIEKCTFCHHRLQKVREQAAAEKRTLHEGDWQPACVEVCPAGAMVFGDLEDPNSQVAKAAHDPRATRQLEDLGTEPKVFHLKRAV